MNPAAPPIGPIGADPVSLEAYLMVGAVLFCLGLVACIARRNAIGILIGIELLLNAANLNLIAFWRFQGGALAGVDGPVFAVFVIILAACEAAVALGIVINLFYNFGTVEVDTINKMRR